MEPASSRPVLTSLASVAFALAVLFLFLAVRGIWPLGGHYLEYMDNGQMVYPHLEILCLRSDDRSVGRVLLL